MLMKAMALVVLGLSLVLARAQPVADLPPGVPRVVNPDGSLYFIEPMFTTRQFQNEALRLVIEEANRVARELPLGESLPITRTNLTEAFISSFGFMLKSKAVGNVTTSNYCYGVERDCKFSDLTIANYDERCLEYRRKYRWPASWIDTNGAHQLATQWVAAAHMDVARLSRECVFHIMLDGCTCGLKPDELPKDIFTPIYSLWWTPRGSKDQMGGAMIELFLPTKTLLQMKVDDPKYILRQPLVFTNLAALFPGKAEITTNWHGKPHVLSPR